MSLLFAPLVGIGTFLASAAGKGLMAVIGGSAMIGGGLKKQKMLKAQDKRARKALEEAENMPIPGLAQQPELNQVARESEKQMEFGSQMMEQGLNQEERQMILNRVTSQNRFSSRADIGSALKRIQETEGILQLGGAIADAKQKGAGIYSAGLQSKLGAATQLQGVRDKVYAANTDRYNAIQKAAGEAFASAQQNQFNANAENRKLATSLLGMAMQPTENPPEPNPNAGGGGGDGDGKGFLPNRAGGGNFVPQGNPVTQQSIPPAVPPAVTTASTESISIIGEGGPGSFDYGYDEYR